MMDPLNLHTFPPCLLPRSLEASLPQTLFVNRNPHAHFAALGFVRSDLPLLVLPKRVPVFFSARPCWRGPPSDQRIQTCGGEPAFCLVFAHMKLPGIVVVRFLNGNFTFWNVENGTSPNKLGIDAGIHRLIGSRIGGEDLDRCT